MFDWENFEGNMEPSVSLFARGQADGVERVFPEMVVDFARLGLCYV